MPEEENMPSRGALSSKLAPTIQRDGFVNTTRTRPADWNSGESNREFYIDPAEVAYERSEAARMQESAESAEAPETRSADNGSAQVQQPPMPKRGRGRPRKTPVPDAGARAAGDNNLPVSGVSRDRDANQNKLPAVRKPRTHQRREATTERGDLTPETSGKDKEWVKAQLLQASLGFQAFDRCIKDAPLSDAMTLYNEIARRVVDAGNFIEDRRSKEKETERQCSFCDHVWTYRGTDVYKARRAFDMPDGTIRVVMACSKNSCLEKFDEYVNQMSTRSRETVH